MTDEDRTEASSSWRWPLLIGGWFCLAAGTVGAVLPLVPTTPFLILAAACFARSSPRMHKRLHANRLVGPYLVQWERDRTVPKHAKAKALALIGVTFAVSIYLVERTELRWVLVAIGVILSAFVWRLPQADAREPSPDR